MSRKIKCIAAALLAPLVMCGGMAGAQPAVYMGTQRVESRMIEVAVPEFLVSGEDPEGWGAQSARIINFDLGVSGYFKVVENYDFLRQATQRDMTSGQIMFEEWRTLASNFLVKGVITRQAQGRLTLEARVYDLQTKKLFFAKRYTGPSPLFRRIAHQFSDDFLNRFTGEQGMARTRIAFVSRVEGRKELFISDYDGADARQVTQDRSIVLFPHINPQNPGLLLFTTFRYRNPDLYALRLSDNTRYPLSRRVGSNAVGEWSPDGTKVAFSLSREGDSDIYTVNADGTEPKRLTFERSIETSPAWSPDGQSIAFTSDRSGSPQVYTMRADGSETKRLSFKGSWNDGSSWSPKGNQIAFTSLLGAVFDIAVVNPADPSSLRNLTNSVGSNEYPSWSPEGRHIAFASTRAGGVKQLFIIRADGGGEARKVTNLAGSADHPSWGPSPE